MADFGHFCWPFLTILAGAPGSKWGPRTPGRPSPAIFDHFRTRKKSSKMASTKIQGHQKRGNFIVVCGQKNPQNFNQQKLKNVTFEIRARQNFDPFVLKIRPFLKSKCWLLFVPILAAPRSYETIEANFGQVGWLSKNSIFIRGFNFYKRIQLL